MTHIPLPRYTPKPAKTTFHFYSNKIEYNIYCTRAAEHGRVAAAVWRLGNRSYRTVYLCSSKRRIRVSWYSIFIVTGHGYNGEKSDVKNATRKRVSVEI